MHNIFGESIHILQTLRRDSAFAAKLRDASAMMTGALKAGNKILWCGNGGSAADCQHLSAELVARLSRPRRALASLALTTDTSYLTARVNDEGNAGDIFSRQIEALAKSGDILVAVSTSGNSPNILRALESAKQHGVRSILFGGNGGGKARGKADLELNVPSRNTQRIQEVHIMIGHIICEHIETAFV
jgi:D-sedoheptulose 7-phosphate isomerase